MMIYQNGLYLSIIAGKILNIKENDIINIYKNLPIHEKKEINIKSDDILKLGIDCLKISSIFKDVEISIINKELKNKKGDIIKYIKRNEW